MTDQTVIINDDWEHPVTLEHRDAPSRARSRSRVALPYVVQYEGRTRRVYSTNYGFNSERVYIVVKGQEVRCV